MEFIKMHGIGNDYIYFNCMERTLENPEALAVRLSDRHTGVGGDGIVLILPSDKADFRMRMFNADGSEGKMCGNATRCIGKYVYDLGLTDKTRLTLETLSGIKTLDLHLENGKVKTVTVDMGAPVMAAKEIPVEMGLDRVVQAPLTVGDKTWMVTCVSMGNPHCVVFCDQVSTLELEKLGPGFEHHPVFPERVNTEFVKVLDRNHLEMRVWERGSGETMACGTGACASAVAAIENGFADRGAEILVELLGGTLSIRYTQEGTVEMTGPAEFVFKGALME
jgi:diaminopimelate epimerase